MVDGGGEVDREVKRERRAAPWIRGWSPVGKCLRDSHGVHKGSDPLSLSQTADQEPPLGRRLLQDRHQWLVFRLDSMRHAGLYLGLNSSEKIQCQDKTICPVSRWRHGNSTLTRKR